MRVIPFHKVCALEQKRSANQPSLTVIRSYEHSPHPVRKPPCFGGVSELGGVVTGWCFGNGVVWSLHRCKKQIRSLKFFPVSVCRMRRLHRIRRLETDLNPGPEQRIRRVFWISSGLILFVVDGVSCVENGWGSVIQECDGAWPAAIGVIPLVALQSCSQVLPVDHILGDGVVPVDCSRNGSQWVVLIEEVVVTFVVYRTCMQAAKESKVNISGWILSTMPNSDYCRSQSKGEVDWCAPFGSVFVWSRKSRCHQVKPTQSPVCQNQERISSIQVIFQLREVYEFLSSGAYLPPNGQVRFSIEHISPVLTILPCTFLATWLQIWWNCIRIWGHRKSWTEKVCRLWDRWPSIIQRAEASQILCLGPTATQKSQNCAIEVSESRLSFNDTTYMNFWVLTHLCHPVDRLASVLSTY